MASTALVTGVLTANGGAVFNETGADVDFRVESDTVDHALFVQGSDGNVGIGTSSPLGKLSVGNGSLTDASLPIQISTSSDGGEAYLGVNRNGGYGALFGFAADATYKGLTIRNIVGTGTSNADGISFATNNTDVRMHIKGDGSVGIGTTSPDAALEVNSGGGIHLSDNTAGRTLIIKPSLSGAIHEFTSDNTSAGFAFSNDTSELLRIDASGALLVGTTTSAGAGGVGLIGQFRAGYQGVLNGFGAENVSSLFYSGGASGGYVAINSDSANSPLYISLTSSATAPSFITFSDTGANVGSINAEGSELAIGSTAAGLQFLGSEARIRPFNISSNAPTDNTIDLGRSNSRFQDIYATNGTINTSDRNEKQDIETLTDAETRVAVAAKGLLRKFRWIDSVEEKGDEARIHFGIIAQDLQDAFTAEGLDAGDYAMFISDTWTDDDGVEQTRLGVRYSELLAFIIAAI
jgi:hypothetical protein